MKRFYPGSAQLPFAGTRYIRDSVQILDDGLWELITANPASHFETSDPILVLASNGYVALVVTQDTVGWLVY